MNQKEFYNTLSEDVKAKIKACQSEEEMMQVLSQEKIELDPELLDSVSGGTDGDQWDKRLCEDRCGCN